MSAATAAVDPSERHYRCDRGRRAQGNGPGPRGWIGHDDPPETSVIVCALRVAVASRAMALGVRLFSEMEGLRAMARTMRREAPPAGQAAAGGPRGQALSFIRSVTNRGAASGHTRGCDRYCVLGRGRRRAIHIDRAGEAKWQCILPTGLWRGRRARCRAAVGAQREPGHAPSPAAAAKAGRAISSAKMTLCRRAHRRGRRR